MTSRTDWGCIIKDQQASGKNAAEFCRERGIRESRFWYWKSRVPRPSGNRTEGRFAPVGELPRIEITLKNGVLLRLPADCGIEALKIVLEALDAVSA